MRAARLTLALALVAQAACAFAQVSPAAGIAGPLAPDRVGKLAHPERAEWAKYATISDRLRRKDLDFIAAELGNQKLAGLTKAPYSAPEFLYGDKPDAWLMTDSARTIADGVLTFQTPSGGWSKRTDMTRPRKKGMSFYSESTGWHYIPTFDNGATTGQVRFLARMARATRRDEYAEAALRGYALLLLAQQPNGCWPQSYPLEGEYHDAITFNDNTVVLILRVLDDVAAGRLGDGSAHLRNGAAASAKRGVECILASQVVIGGKPTVWGQQHDPLTLAPSPARLYELAGLSGRESAGLMSYLMTIPSPSPKVIAAVHGAADWFRANETRGVRYDPDKGIQSDSSGKPVWARLTDVETGKPIFSNRDGVKLYDWTKLTDRRVGYAWFSDEPAGALRQYDKWALKYPRSVR